MKTIEERAEIYEKEYPHIDDSHYSYYVRDGYVQGATDQKHIDIEKAFAWLRYNRILDGWDNETIIDFQKAMES